MNKPICFVASARDYHAMDWFHRVQNICCNRRVFVITDSVSSEGFKSMILADDEVISIISIDHFLFSSQSWLGNLWRNMIKLLTAPIFGWKLHFFASQNRGVIFHAHSMFYIFVCAIARVNFIATPMGSDVLVRPDRSVVYKFLTKFSLKRASLITVDSERLVRKIFAIASCESVLIQNGINTAECLDAAKLNSQVSRKGALSIRALDSNYRIKEILCARDYASPDESISFIYPFADANYASMVRKNLQNGDTDLGRLDRAQMYEAMANTKIVFSIPSSDSSPRSVYEAVFCGAAVATTYSGWLDALPKCMSKRIIVVDLEDAFWFKKAMKQADSIISEPFVPTNSSLEAFDEELVLRKMVRDYYV